MGRHPSRRHLSPDEAPVGPRIRARRRDLGLTQTDLAAPEYTKSFISQIEAGHADPSLDTLRFLGRRLHMGLSALAGDAADLRLSTLAGLLDWAQAAITGERAESARRAIEVARDIAHEAGSGIYAAAVLLLQADLELEAGALDRAEAALDEISRLPAPIGLHTPIRAALTRGRLALRRRDPVAAASAFRSAWERSRRSPRFPALAARAIIGLAVATVQDGEVRAARRHLNAAIRLAKRHRLDAWRGRALIVLAEISRIEGRLDEADQHLREASQVLADAADRVAQADVTMPVTVGALDRLI